MNNTDTTTTGQDPTQLYDCDVIDSDGNKVGTVDGVWVDDATGRLEFVGAKTGWLLGKNHIIPVENAQTTNGQVQVPFTQDQIKGAPSFSSDQELSPADEDQIYSYYGMERSTSTSPTGYAQGGTGPSTSSTQNVDTSGTDVGTTGEGKTIDVPVSEEDLQVGKREVQTGNVRVRKVVRSEQKDVPVELKREDVVVERVPAGDSTNVPDNAFQEGDVQIPITEEQPVVGKEAHVAGQVRVGKVTETDTQTVSGQVRREDVEVDEDVEEVDPNSTTNS